MSTIICEVGMYFMYPSCYSESRLTSPNKPVSPSPFLLTSCLIGLASPHRTPPPPPAARRATLVPRDPHCPARSEPPCKLATQHTVNAVESSFTRKRVRLARGHVVSVSMATSHYTHQTSTDLITLWRCSFYILAVTEDL